MMDASMSVVGTLHVRMRGSSAEEFQVSVMYLHSSTPPMKWNRMCEMLTCE